MPDNYSTIQFDRFDSRASFLEICECFSLDKIRLGFRTFDQSKEKGNRTTASIDIYITMRDANELAYQIKSNRIAHAKEKLNNLTADKSDANAPLYKSKIGGTMSGNTIRYREFSIFAGSKAAYAIGAFSGIGKKDDKGLIQKVNKPDVKIFVPLSEEDLRGLAEALKRAVNSYDFIKTIDFYKRKKSQGK